MREESQAKLWCMISGLLYLSVNLQLNFMHDVKDCM